MLITLSQLKFLFKEWRSKEFRLLSIALILAVTVMTMLSFYTTRINNTLDRQAAEYLGGDIVVRGSLPIPASWKQKAAQLNCGIAETTLFISMISHAEQLQLANIKAVSSSYPLYGHLQILDERTQQSINAIGVPAAGTVWIDQQFLKLLAIHLHDSITLGAATFKVTHILTHEPDASPFGFSIAPRVLMNELDLPRTQTLQPGSQVEYRLHLIGAVQHIQAYKNWLRPQLKPQQRLVTIRQGAAELSDTLNKGNLFLQLTVLICIVLAGIAIATTARYFCERQASSVALLRCFGLTHQQIIAIYSIHLALLGCVSAAMGCLLGYVSQLGLAKLLSDLLQLKLLPISIGSSIPGMLFGLTLLFAFAFPSLYRLKQAAPILVLRKQPLPIANSTLLAYLAAAVMLGGLLIWFIRDTWLLIFIASGFGLTAIGLYGIAWLLVKMLTPLRQQVGISWRYGLANLSRRANSSIVQIIAFGFVFMVTLLLFITRNDLISAWQKQIPVDAPNFFALNIAPTEVSQFRQILAQHAVATSESYPIIKGRLVSLNNKPILEAVPLNARKSNSLKRELNLTWTATLPKTNTLVSGSWWTISDKNKPVVSMDAKLAERFAIHIGDVLGFQIGSEYLAAKVQSLRSIDWNSFQPNFFIIFPPYALAHYPTTYLTSFYLTDNKRALLPELTRQFPNITLIDIDALLSKVHSVIANIAIAIHYILGFTFLAGILILYATLQANRDERVYEGAILKTLGVSKHSLYVSLMTEYTTLGILSGILAVCGANLTAAILAEAVFKIPFHLNYALCLISPFLSGIVIGCLGFISTYKIADTATVSLLREY